MFTGRRMRNCCASATSGSRKFLYMRHSGGFRRTTFPESTKPRNDSHISRLTAQASLPSHSKQFFCPMSSSNKTSTGHRSSPVQRLSARKWEARMQLDHALLKNLPKVLLHEHLDGVLRPETVIELAKSVNYDQLPTEHPEELARWFHQGANQGSLAKYLEGFVHTIAVMQSEEALERVAYEQAADLSADGIVYFETRFAPVFHTRTGLSHQQVVSAVLKGLERGKKDFGVSSGLIICAMRNMDVSLEMAELAVDFRARGVVGFDLAGEEGGFPPKKHVDAFHYIQRQNFSITIHAGEGFGKESIWQAIQYCGAHRIGHGTRLIDDIAVAEDGKVVKFGDLAQYVLDKRIPLEICLLSNVQTGAARSLAEHPFKTLYQEKFRVTLNTDNRLMSDTTMTKEFEAARDTFGLTLDDFEILTVNAMKSAFLPYHERCDFIYKILKPGYAKIRRFQAEQ